MWFVEQLLLFTWWQYLALAVILLLIAVAFVFYKGYRRIKPTPLKGIPYPPMTSILGHAEQMLHELRHLFRLHVMDSFNHPVHQLMMSSQCAVFVNDPLEVGNVLRTVPTKGRIYGGYRYDQSIPDIFACDFEAFTKRKTALSSAFESLRIPADSTIFDELLAKLKQHAESKEDCNIGDLFAAFTFDIICESAFGYRLNALHGSSEGRALITSLRTMHAYRATVGIYADPKARKVSKEELQEAQDGWRAVLRLLFSHILKQAKEKGSLDPASNFGDALLQLVADNSEISEPQVISEIHQVLRHGEESIAGSLFWLTYIINRNKKVREGLEALPVPVVPDEEVPEYVECVIKEALRRYPAAGNMTIRTPHSEPVQLLGRYTVPAGTPIFLHMFSHHNSSQQWSKPQLFSPQRWAKGASEDDRPTCPFLSSAASNPNDPDADYEGLGFEPGALSYFPFSVGDRKCLGRGLALQVLRAYLMKVVPQFRLSPKEESLEEDHGQSLEATIVPKSQKSYIMKVRQLASRGEGEEEQNEGISASRQDVDDDDDGWADEDE